MIGWSQFSPGFFHISEWIREGTFHIRVHGADAQGEHSCLMLVLLDQGTPVQIRRVLNQHTVKTAREQGWSTLLNGKLLRAAQLAGFHVLGTPDQNIIYQQNLANLKIALVVLTQNRWSLIEPALDKIAAAVNTATPGTYTVVEIMDPRPRR